MFGKREGLVGSFFILLNFKLLFRLPLGNIFKLGFKYVSSCLSQICSKQCCNVLNLISCRLPVPYIKKYSVQFVSFPVDG